MNLNTKMAKISALRTRPCSVHLFIKMPIFILYNKLVNIKCFLAFRESLHLDTPLIKVGIRRRIKSCGTECFNLWNLTWTPRRSCQSWIKLNCQTISCQRTAELMQNHVLGAKRASNICKWKIHSNHSESILKVIDIFPPCSFPRLGKQMLISRSSEIILHSILRS